MDTIKDFISKCSNQGQCISLYLLDSNENEYYLCATKVRSRIFQYIGNLEVSRWSVDRDGNMAVYVKDKEDGGVEKMQNSVSVGLYRHFKGAYYYVTGLSKSATDEKTIMVNYFNVCHPEYGSFVRPLEDFISDHDTKANGIVTIYIRDRKDNVTGQHHRMERVKDLNFQLGSVSTETLIDELSRRDNSPLQKLDIEGLNSRVFSTDFVVGDKNYETEDYSCGVSTIATFNTEEEAKNYYETHKHISATGVFKRTFIEVE